MGLFLTRMCLASALPLSLFLAGWWGSVGRIPEEQIPIAALTGLAMGVLVDIIWFRRQIQRPYDVSPKIICSIFLFGSVCFLGFFMGVPVFNLLPGAATGLYAGQRLSQHGIHPSEAHGIINRVSRLSAWVMGGVCLASAYWALKDPGDTASNLQGMLGIRSFDVTPRMVVAVVIIGGPALVFIQHRLTGIVARLAYSHETRR